MVIITLRTHSYGIMILTPTEYKSEFQKNVNREKEEGRYKKRKRKKAEEREEEGKEEMN